MSGVEPLDLLVDDTEGVRTITLNRPAKKNALTFGMRADIVRAVTEADEDPAIRLVVFTGAGGDFCAGADLAAAPRASSPDEAHHFMGRTSQAVARALSALRTPTLARVRGIAAGAGMFLALHCDVVVAADDARFIPSQIKLGLPPDWGALWLLPRLVGQTRARAMLLKAAPIAARDAAAWGLIAHCEPAGRLDAVIDDYRRAVLATPGLTVDLIKDGLAAGAQGSLEQFLAWEAAAIGLALTTEAYETRVAAFLARASTSASAAAKEGKP